MKMIETLTEIEIYEILISVSPQGLFKNMFKTNEVLSKYAGQLTSEYYIVRSGQKTVSPLYETWFDTAKRIMEQTYPDLVVSDADVIAFISRYIGEYVIEPKYIDKWTRIYNALVAEQYNPLHNYEMSEHKTGNNTDTDTHNTTKARKGTNSDITTYDTNVEDNGKTGTNETTIRNVEDANDVYGFNSSSPVGDTYSNETTSETIVGEADKNTSHNVQTKTGTENKQFGIDENETHTGTDTTTYDINENIIRDGRNSSGAELLEKELDMRNKYILFDIILKDVDSVATLPIYI